MFKDMKAADFTKLLGYGEIGVGALLLLPTVPSAIAGGALAAFGAGTTAEAAAVVDALSGAVGEALTNAHKHGGATRATVFVDVDDAVFCSVKDDGDGFDPAASAAGSGITSSINGRLAEVGGSAEIDARPGSGVEVRLHERDVRGLVGDHRDAPVAIYKLENRDRIIVEIERAFGSEQDVFSAGLVVAQPHAPRLGAISPSYALRGADGPVETSPPPSG